ncbi:MAG: DUF5668 domain-containing protein [bacterium]
MNKSRFLSGTFFLFIGFVLLGTNLHWWNIDVWNVLFAFWPLILILIGLAMIIRNNVVMTIIAFAMIVAILLITKTNPNLVDNGSFHFFNNEPLTSELSSKPLETNTTTAKFNIDLGALNITTRELPSDSPDLFTSTSKLNKNLKIEEHFTNNVKEINFSEDIATSTFSKENREFNLNLTQLIPIEINLKTGASKADLDFRKLQITKLNIDSGASASDISFGSLVKSVETTINTGASKYTINIPKEYAINIISDSGLLAQNFSSLNLEKTENNYKSRDWESNDKKMKFNFSAGVSKIDILQY